MSLFAGKQKEQQLSEATEVLVEAAKSTLQILDTSGHTEVQWDPDDKKEVKAAKETFDQAIKDGYTAFSLEPDGKKGELIRTFDPTAGRIVMQPRMVGG